MTKLKLPYYGHNMRRQGSLEKIIIFGIIEGSRESGRSNMRWIESIHEVIRVSLQELSRAVEDRTLWISLIHRVSRKWNQLNGT